METWQLDLAGLEVRLEQRTRLVVLQEAGLQEAHRGLLRGDCILLRRQVDTETEHEHFIHRVEGGRVWLSCGKRLLDSGVHLAARAASLAAISGLGLVIFSIKITSQTIVFFFKSKTKTMLRRISSQTSSLLKVSESLSYAV